MSWISDNAVNIDQLDDEFDIDSGLPAWLEKVAGPMFFPRLSRGIALRDGRRMQVRRSNADNKYAIDLALYLDDVPVAAIDVERKRLNTSYLFDRDDLPVNVPLYTLRAHRSGDYVGFDGGPAYSGKVRVFRRHPAQSFFMAIRHDATRALMVRGSDVVNETSWEWVNAKGGYHDDQIYVARVPRELALDCSPATNDAEDFVLDVIGPKVAAA